MGVKRSKYAKIRQNCGQNADFWSVFVVNSVCYYPIVMMDEGRLINRFVLGYFGKADFLEILKSRVIVFFFASVVGIVAFWNAFWNDNYHSLTRTR